MRHAALSLAMAAAIVFAQAAVAAPSTTRPAAPPLPTEADARASFDRGEYADVLKQLHRLLALKPEAAKTAEIDRYALTMLKGESHLRLKQTKAATDAFGAAAKVTDDETLAATARATQKLVQESKGGRVQRKTAPAARGSTPQSLPDSADLLNPEQREDALRIVHADLLAAAEPKVKAARRARTLAPIAEAFEALAATRDFELALGEASASTGDDAAAREALAERAVELIGKELSGMERDVANIQALADSVAREQYVERRSLRYGVETEGEFVKNYRGVTDADVRKLKEMVGTCAKIMATADQLAKTPGADRTEADKLVDRTKDLGRAIERLIGASPRNTQRNR